MGLQYAVIRNGVPSSCGIGGCLCNLSAKYKHLSISWKVCVWSTTLIPIINTSTNSIIYLYRYSLYLLILLFYMALTGALFFFTLVTFTCITLFFCHFHVSFLFVLLLFLQVLLVLSSQIPWLVVQGL